jgi:hypothetical protein
MLADLCAVWLAERPHEAPAFPADPGEVIDDVLAATWTDDDGGPLHPVAYSVGGYHGPILPTSTRSDTLAAVVAKLGTRGAEVASAYGDLPEIVQASEYDWETRQEVERQQRECFALTDADGNAARAFGCLLEVPRPDGRREHAYVTDAEWLADRLVQKIAAHAAAEAERKAGRTKGAPVGRLGRP